MSDGVTEQALSRLSHLPGSTNPADMIAAQKYYDVEFTGGSITGITPSDLPSPLAIVDGGTGHTTANTALNALLPSQTGNNGKVLSTNGTNTSWGTVSAGITQLTGDATAGPGSGSQALTLATVNGNVGTFGSSTSIPIITTNGKGLGTAYSTASVIAPAGTLSGATLASGVTASSLTSFGAAIALGTPGSGTLTNCTGLPASTGISGLGTNVATFLATPTSANLAAALTDETGSGAAVFAISPALTGTPTTPTASPGTNTTQIASTAFVHAALNTPNTYQATPSNPASTTSTAGVMMGLAGAFTPTRSGVVLMVISGDLLSAGGGASQGASAQIRYGTGTAPINGAALTGTATGGSQKIVVPNTFSFVAPFSCQSIVSGLTLSTAIWIDVSLAAIVGGTATMADVSISIFEL